MPGLSGLRSLTTTDAGRVGAIAVSPSDAKTIYAGTGESDIRSDLSSGNGVYKSSDGGVDLEHVGLEDTRQISRIVVDPHDANVVYVGALGHAYGPNEQRGVYKSVDGGAHWVKALDTGSEIGVSDLAVCSGNPQMSVCRDVAYASAAVEHLCSHRRTRWRALSLSGRRQDLVSTQRQRITRR